MSIFERGGYIGKSVTYPGTNIVTDGLVLYLDAGDVESYPGTGSTWTDLSSEGNDATSSGSPIFSTNYFTFDGAVDQFNVTTAYTTVTNNFTYSVWARPTATHQIDAESNSTTTGTSGQKYLIRPVLTDNTSPYDDAGAGISCGTNGVSVYEHTGAYMPPLLVHSATISSSVPTLITVVYTNRQPTLYLNGVFARTGLTSGKNTVYMRGDGIGWGDYGYFEGSVYHVCYYDRSLGPTEVLQNYNALRGRFGL